MSTDYYNVDSSCSDFYWFNTIPIKIPPGLFIQFDNRSEDVYKYANVHTKTQAHFVKGYSCKMDINVISNLPVPRHCGTDPRMSVDIQII